MLRNFCDKCGKEISLEHHCEITSRGFNVDPMKPGCGEDVVYLGLCDNCHKEMHNLIKGWNPDDAGWISVETIKPQFGILVKIKFKDGTEDERRFSYDYKWVSKGMETCESIFVTHWRPILEVNKSED